MSSLFESRCIERLDLLPLTFKRVDLERILGVRESRAKEIIRSWLDMGLVDTLHQGAYEKTYFKTQKTGKLSVPAICRIIYPQAVRIGVELLPEDWAASSQEKRLIEIAVPTGEYGVSHKNREQLMTSGVLLSTRSHKWFNVINKHYSKRAGAGDLPRLLPDWALADMLGRLSDPRCKSVRGSELLKVKEDVIDKDHILLDRHKWNMPRYG